MIGLLEFILLTLLVVLYVNLSVKSPKFGPLTIFLFSVAIYQSNENSGVIVPILTL